MLQVIVRFFARMLEVLAEFSFAHRKGILWTVGIITAALGAAAAFKLDVRSAFDDMMPSDHPYIEVHKRYNEAFGGVNMLAIMVQAEKGSVFQPDALQVIHDLTDAMQYVDAVNQYQIISLASRKLKDVRASTEGIESKPLMWPDVPKTQEEIDALRLSVISNPLVYGKFVSRDLTSAMIVVGFIDRMIPAVGYPKIYKEIKDVIAKAERPGIRIRAVGEPVLMGMAVEFVPQSLLISAAIIISMALLLFITMRTWRGMLLPMLTAVVSALVSMGTIALLGVNLDPLMIVVIFLISARAISHSVQFCAAFDDERELGMGSSFEAAKNTFVKLFRPSVLGLVVDIGGILIVMVTPIPLLQKAAIVGAVWLASLMISAVIMIPLQLSWIKSPHGEFAIPFNLTKYLVKFADICAILTSNAISATIILLGAVAILALAAFEAMHITVGDAYPGTPVLWPNSEFNRNVAAINEKFEGADQMFVVVAGDDENSMKDPKVLGNVFRLQRYMEELPQTGGSLSFADVLMPINMMLHEGNPRYFELGPTRLINGELAFMFISGSDPGDVDRFVDNKFQHGAVNFFFHDHKGETIHSAMDRLKEFIAKHPLEGAHYELAGGYMGVMAAINEVIFKDQIKTIALALIVLFICCWISYGFSPQAGLFFLPLILLSNAVTFAFMTWQGIGMNINTLPIAALGIGLGVDYAFYVVDRIRERFAETRNLRNSVRFSLETAGRGVIITGVTMVISVVLWSFSSIRFQAEMGMLIALWMSVSAISALLVIPAMIFLFKPSFVIGGLEEVTEEERALLGAHVK